MDTQKYKDKQLGFTPALRGLGFGSYPSFTLRRKRENMWREAAKLLA